MPEHSATCNDVGFSATRAGELKRIARVQDSRPVSFMRPLLAFGRIGSLDGSFRERFPCLAGPSASLPSYLDSRSPLRVTEVAVAVLVSQCFRSRRRWSVRATVMPGPRLSFSLPLAGLIAHQRTAAGFLPSSSGGHLHHLTFTATHQLIRHLLTPHDLYC